MILLFLAIITNCKAQQDRPNILWIVCEDISQDLSIYGDNTALTPHIDALAAESTIYKNAFATVGVCGPSRSSIITGMYPTAIGTMHMRTGKDISSHGKRQYKIDRNIKDIDDHSVIEYSAVIPDGVKCFTEYLRESGYYCTNNSKTDYQFASPLTAWDENNNKAHYKNRKGNQPFFSVFNYNVTHESMLWKNRDKPLTIDLSQVKVPPYLPDTELIRADIARHYSNIEILDTQVGQLINELKADGLYDNTVIFFYSDHGGPLPREKRECYDSGLKVPLIVKYPESCRKGSDGRLISLIDLSATVLDIAEVSIPEYMSGRSFAKPNHDSDNMRTYIYGSGDRFDEYTDRVRIIRTDSFLYVKNYYANLSGYKDLTYRKNIVSMNQFLDFQATGLLDPVIDQWFQLKKEEELYYVINDPYNISNLSDDVRYQSNLNKLRNILIDHDLKNVDFGELNEAEMVEKMWPNKVQPQTLAPSVSVKNGKLHVTCNTPSSSIAYLRSNEDNYKLDRNDTWQLYSQPIQCTGGEVIYFIAERIGYRSSELVEYKQFDE